MPMQSMSSRNIPVAAEMRIPLEPMPSTSTACVSEALSLPLPGSERFGGQSMSRRHAACAHACYDVCKQIVKCTVGAAFGYAAWHFAQHPVALLPCDSDTAVADCEARDHMIAMMLTVVVPAAASGGLVLHGVYRLIAGGVRRCCVDGNETERRAAADGVFAVRSRGGYDNPAFALPTSRF